MDFTNQSVNLKTLSSNGSHNFTSVNIKTRFLIIDILLYFGFYITLMQLVVKHQYFANADSMVL